MAEVHRITKETKKSFGGQAVIEGVMMQGEEGRAIAVRMPDGTIKTKIDTTPPLRQRHKLFQLPILRGFISFIDSFVSGMQTLTWSAAQAGEEEEEKLSGKEIAFAVILAVVLAIGLFVVLPVWAAAFTLPYIGPFGRSLVEGLLRVAIFILYLLLIRRMDDIKRIFRYHGAEHKTIHTYEAGEALTPENIQKHSTLHPRCGTSFIIFVMILLIIIFTFIGQGPVLYRISIKILCLPLVAGLSYELLRFTARHEGNFLVRLLMAPGLWIQRLTTAEPDDAMTEIAACALYTVPDFPRETYPGSPVTPDNLQTSEV